MFANVHVTHQHITCHVASMHTIVSANATQRLRTQKIMMN